MRNKLAFGAWASIGVFVSIIVIFIVIVYMRGGAVKTRADYEFDYQSYYTPAEGSASEKAVFSQLAGVDLYDQHCPVSKLNPTSQGIIVNSFGTPASMFIFTGQDLGLSDADRLNMGAYTQWSQYLSPIGYNSSYSLLSEVSTKIVDKDYYTIVAPFNFIYNNRNIDGNNIFIESVDRTCKIEFYGVDNWFCSGDKPFDNSDGLTVEDWLAHSKAHNTIVGNSINAKITGGNAGVILGYGNGTTTVKCSRKTSTGEWKECTISDLYATTFN